MAHLYSLYGTTASGFEAVEREFHRNFVHRGELGAACAVYYRREKVVDLWGGWRDSSRQLVWERDTLVPVFSTTKGIAALTMALAHSRGLYAYDEKVAAYWSEFAQNRKADVSVRQLLSHQAGLCAIDQPLNIQALKDSEFVSRGLAAQNPAWEPGTRHGYHIFSLGLYENELLRRVDPLNRPLGQYFRDEIAHPLGLDFHIGLPESVSPTRVAQVVEQQPSRYLFNLHKIPPRALVEMFNPRSLLVRSAVNPQLASINSAEMQRLGMPSMGGIGLIRDIARLYSEFEVDKSLAFAPTPWKRFRSLQGRPPADYST